MIFSLRNDFVPLFHCMIKKTRLMGGNKVGLLSFLKSKPEPDKTVARAPASAAPAQEKAADPARDPEAIVVRSEIVDERSRLCGYRFSVPFGANRVAMPEPVVMETLVAARLPEFAQKRLALVQLSMDTVVFNRHLPLVAPHTIFMLDRKAGGLPIEQIAGRMAALRETGCKVALRGVTLDAEDAPLLALCDIAMLYLNEHTLAEF